MKRRHLLLLFLILGMAALHADVKVKDVVVKPRWPWNGLVDITYSIECDEMDDDGNPKDVYLDFTAIDGDLEKEMAMKSLAGDGANSPVKAGGPYTVTWDASKDYPNFHTSDLSVRIHATAIPSYLVVDLLTWKTRSISRPPDHNNDTCRTTELWLRRIPAGTFTMGSPEDEVGRFNTDMSQHEVTLTQTFYIGVFECTQKQWELVMGNNPSHNKGDCRPIEYVSFNLIRGTAPKAGSGWPIYDAVDASSFMGKLQEKTGLKFDLPTEAQWEYACRAGTTTALNSGRNLNSEEQDSAMDEVGRYIYNRNDGKGGYVEHTNVGSYMPNAWGLYDMHGNVWEWCLDWWGANTNSTSPATDPIGPLSGTYRLLRGGYWYRNAANCRSAMRSTINPSEHGNGGFGFRIVCIPNEILYAVVDLSEGANATEYPVYYTDRAPDLNDDACRTTELWLRKIPKGTFTMGSPEDEVGRFDGETQHEVALTRDYYIGVFECTQKQWELVMGVNPSNYKGDCRPVESISYNMIRGSSAAGGAGWPAYGHDVDIGSFMGKLQEKTGLMFDLPTEAQWEYACRAGTTTAFNSGVNLINASGEDPNMNEIGRYCGNVNDGKGYTEHTNVGSYRPNEWGLYDMHGNVYEWCLDWYGDYSSEAVYDPVGVETSEYHVLRGGNWANALGGSVCRSAYRWYGKPASTWSGRTGFRIVFMPDIVMYTVVDLSGGPDASKYPVRCSSKTPNLDDDTCRTTELWLRKIPAGTFTMGSPKDEIGRRENYDMAQHEVTLTKKFYVGIFECTQRQWELIMGNRPSHFNNDDYYATRPVEQVSFDMIRGTEANAGGGWPTYDAVDASSFMGKLQAKTGLKFDLPTEAQWEYACRAGTTTALNSGKNLTSEDSDPNMDEVGRYYYNGGRDYSQSCTTDNGTAKVGSYMPNAWGLYDMHGNVAEWVLDWWGGGANSTDSVEDPKGPVTGPYRRFRGGYSSAQAYTCRSGNRTNGGAPADIGFTVGLRIVCLP